MKTTTALALLVATAAAAAPAAAVQGTADHDRGEDRLTRADRRQLDVVRRATAKYRDVRVALRDGFVPTDECYGEPGQGVMGFHYAHPRRVVDQVHDPKRPDILIYLPGKGGRRELAAVEWYRLDPDQDLSTAAGRPRILGRPFEGPMIHSSGGPAHFDKHVWLFKRNPAGTFAPFNPAAHC